MKKIILIVSSIVVLIIAVALGAYIIDALRFKLVDSSPVGDIYPVGTTDAMYKFNKDLDPKKTKNNFIVSVEPKQNFEIKIDKDTLHVLFPQPPKQDFKLSILSIKSNRGDTISSLSYNYTVSEIPESQLTEYELNRRMALVDIGVDSPLLSVDMMPLYKISQSQSVKYPDDPKKRAVYISYSKPTDKFAAIKYIYDSGYDPSDYEIIFNDRID